MEGVLGTGRTRNQPIHAAMKTTLSAALTGLCLLTPADLFGNETQSVRQRTGPAASAAVHEGPATVSLGIEVQPEAPPPPARESPAAPEIDSIDVRDAGFRTPVSVTWDKAADVYLVANVHGHLLDPDDNGFISRVRPDGTVDALKWIDGAAEGVTLHAPKGMAVLGDSLWVADMDVVRRFDRVTGKARGEIAVEGASYLKDLTPVLFPGGDGTHLLLTDSGLARDGITGLKPNGRPRLVALDTTTGEVKQHTMPELRDVFRELRFGARPEPANEPAMAEARRRYFSDDPFGPPVSIAFVGAGYALTGGDLPCLYVMQANDRGGFTSLEMLPAGRLDGVVAVFWEQMLHGDRPTPHDGPGGFLVSSGEGRCVYHLDGNRITRLVSDLHAPADLGYDVKRNRVLIPLSSDDTLLIRPGPKSSN